MQQMQAADGLLSSACTIEQILCRAPQRQGPACRKHSTATEATSWAQRRVSIAPAAERKAWENGQVCSQHKVERKLAYKCKKNKR